MYPELLAAITARESEYAAQVADVDQQAAAIYASSGASDAVEFVTAYGEGAGNGLVEYWKTLFGSMFVKFRDGYVVTENKDQLSCGCSVGNEAYAQDWYDRIAQETGTRYEKPVSVSKSPMRPASRSKLTLKSFL